MSFNSEFERYATMSREEWREEYNRLTSREDRVQFLEEKAKLLGVSKLYIMRYMRREV